MHRSDRAAQVIAGAAGDRSRGMRAKAKGQKQEWGWVDYSLNFFIPRTNKHE